MEKERKIFEKIANQLVLSGVNVSHGKMMSSPAIKYKTKVFTFYDKKEMVFKLGKDFDPKTHNLQHTRVLSPFKNKIPLSGWLVVSSNESNRWEELAYIALEKLKKQLN
ncbi:hypothetical protein [Chengkuizengella sediminis]|uniref:hypothetical protein n=1 Tax=Chengkuizengella sediminis TaxID=1885917 RepID=UPI00138978D1|nr:hypothetical protein [Chengkuizengella sediminis]NDI35627.1 hypothetical protein [Chengkuizengella sediminis]